MKKSITNKATSVREARAILSEDNKGGNDAKKEAVRQEMEAISSAEITDALTWDNDGNVFLKPSDQLPLRMKKAIKKIKTRKTEHGNEIELEMHDKIRSSQLLMKHHGMLSATVDQNRPTLIGINVKHAEPITYEVKDNDGEKKRRPAEKNED